MVDIIKRPAHASKLARMVLVLAMVLLTSGVMLSTPSIAYAAVGNVDRFDALKAAVSSSGSGDVVLSNNVTLIEVAGFGDGLLGGLTVERSLTLDLNGYTLAITYERSGANANVIKLASGVTLTVIDSSVGGTGALNVQNNSNLSAEGAGAAINTTDGTFIIQSGTVFTKTSAFGAAIGGGGKNGIGGAGGNIRIEGGNVTATATGCGGAAIGGGLGAGVSGTGGAGGNITISGANTVVNATTTSDSGSDSGAGIGGGVGDGNGGSGGTISIQGGTVNATSIRGAAIGGGDSNASGGAGETINITGGNIAAAATGGGAAIGGGAAAGNSGTGGAGGSVTISGASTVVNANVTGGYGAGIGGGGSAGSDGIGGAGGSVVITQAQVSANGYRAGGTYARGMDIGSGEGFDVRGSGGTLSIDNGATLALTKNGTDATLTGSIGVCTITDATGSISGTYSALTMTGGSASFSHAQSAYWKTGIIKSGTSVSITASTPPGGQSFFGWTASPALTFANASATTTTFTMPANVQAVTATFGNSVSAITVTGAGNATTITTNGGTLQMLAAILPADAAIQTVTWSVTNGTGAATISADGLLTALLNGTVTVRATANDGTGVYGEKTITISGQPANTFAISAGKITIEPGANANTVKVTNGAQVTDNIPEAEQIVIIGTSTDAEKTIVAQGGVTVNVTLNNVSIDVSHAANACAFVITGGSKVNLTLVGASTLKSGEHKAGLEVSTGNSVTIGGSGSINADSKADVSGVSAAGIGGSRYQSGGNITISSGTVTAIASNGGAGIGGGENGAGGNILIYGENTNVTAKGGQNYSPHDIGSGYSGAASNVFIALPADKLTLSGYATVDQQQAPNTVAFTATPASLGTVTATLPAPFDAAGAINILSNPTTTAKYLSVITTFTTENVSFALAGYANSPIAKTGTALMTAGASVAFEGVAPPTPLSFTDSASYDIPVSTVGTAIVNIDVSGGASGGTTPYTFTASGLPVGITISEAGIISGTPTAHSLGDTATITVTDDAGLSADITIAYGEISLATYPALSHFDEFTGVGTSTARVDADHTKFVRLLKDGVEVDAEHYAITPGSTIITLSEPYLQTLPNGAHSYTAEFTDGVSETLNLSVNVPAAPTPPPASPPLLPPVPVPSQPALPAPPVASAPVAPIVLDADLATSGAPLWEIILLDFALCMLALAMFTQRRKRGGGVLDAGLLGDGFV